MSVLGVVAELRSWINMVWGEFNAVWEPTGRGAQGVTAA